MTENELEKVDETDEFDFFQSHVHEQDPNYYYPNNLGQPIPDELLKLANGKRKLLEIITIMTEKAVKDNGPLTYYGFPITRGFFKLGKAKREQWVADQMNKVKPGSGSNWKFNRLYQDTESFKKEKWQVAIAFVLIILGYLIVCILPPIHF